MSIRFFFENVEHYMINELSTFTPLLPQSSSQQELLVIPNYAY